MHQVRVVPQAEYIFKHVLTQVVVYETLLLQQRKELHAKVGHAIESLYAERLEQHYEALANHFSQSEEVDKAVEYLEKAGDKAAKFSWLSDAGKFYGSALGFLKQGVNSAGATSRYVDIAIKWGSPVVPSDELVEVLGQALAYVQELNDDVRHATLRIYRGFLLYRLGKPRSADPDLKVGVEIAARIENHMLHAHATQILGRISLFCWGNCASALEYARASIEAYARANIVDSVEEINSRWLLGMLCACRGEFEKSNEYLMPAHQRSTDLGNDWLRGWLTHAIAWQLRWRGEWDAAKRWADTAIELAQAVGEPLMEAYSRTIAGYSRLFTGAASEALVYGEESLKSLEKGGSTMLKCLLIADFAEACCLVDQGERGAEMVSLALENPPDDDAWAGIGLLRAKGMIEAARRSPDWSLALQALDESIQNTQGGGWRPELSITHFRYAECLHKKGVTATCMTHPRYRLAA